jgi:hypothetical protein
VVPTMDTGNVEQPMGETALQNKPSSTKVALAVPGHIISRSSHTAIELGVERRENKTAFPADEKPTKSSAPVVRYRRAVVLEIACGF